MLLRMNCTATVQKTKWLKKFSWRCTGERCLAAALKLSCIKWTSLMMGCYTSFQLVVIITIDLISAWIFNFKVRLEASQLCKDGS